jgi:pimeloyl-ACP methyl ester carboxylesterase
VLKAAGPNPKPDPVVYLSGGPGGRGIETVSSWRDRAFSRDRDIVLIDQRGTGSSDPLCPESAKEVIELMAKDLSPSEDVEQNVQVAQRCLDSLRQRSIDPGAYGSAVTVGDLEALRVQLGYGSWNLLGISYGTRLALTATRDRPEGIRSVGMARLTLQLLGSEHALAIVAGVPGAGAWFVLPKIILLARLGSFVMAVLTWRKTVWSRMERWHYLMTLAAASGLVVFLLRYDLF